MSSGQRLHPLDDITAAEITNATRIIREDDNFLTQLLDMKVEWDFISMANLDPPKRDLLPLLREGDGADYSNIPRKSTVVVQQKNSMKCGQFIVNQTTGSVERFIGAKGKKASITVDELAAAEEIGKQDPTARARLSREYNIPEDQLDTMVTGDSWSFGYNGPTDQDSDYNDKRMINIYYYFRRKDGENQLPHGVGFISLVDLTARKVVRITELAINEDFSYNQDNLEIPERSCNYLPMYLPRTYFRTDIKPYVISQPEGPSFKINGSKVSWQKWNFRVAFNYRTGLILHYITYDDKDVGSAIGDEAFKSNGKVVTREVLYQLGISEMVIPYGDPRPPYYRKSAFDMGEYGMGYFANSLAKDCDCLGDESTNSVQYMDFSYSDTDGNPITIKRTVCIHEEDAGISHKHTDYRTNKAYLVRSRRLVVASISSIANYVYMFYYYFYLDGTIQFEVKASGKLITNLLGRGSQPAGHGTRVFPLVSAQYHQHIFCARMDFIVDGQKNTVAMTDIVPVQGNMGSSTNPYGNGFTVQKTTFRRAKESVTDIDAEKSRFWEVMNPNKNNKITNAPVAWKLIPNSGSFPRMLAKKSSFVVRRSQFATHSLWVTPFRDEELYPAGFFIYQSHGNEGLQEWVNRNENISNTDIVVWHTFGFTHVPRLEDYPIMPVEYLGYFIKPYNAFESNPALDVPPGSCSSMQKSAIAVQDEDNCDKCWWGARRTPDTITCEHRVKFEPTRLEELKI